MMSLEDIFYQLESLEDCFDEEELEKIERLRSCFYAGEKIPYEAKLALEEMIETAYERYG